MMRFAVGVVALAAASMALSGCGPKPQGSESPASAQSAAPPPTATQAKAMVAALPAPYNTGDIEHGAVVFNQCRSCHTPEQGAGNMVGPNLWGVFGRKAGSLADFNYSDGLKGSGITWDAPSLDKWISGPRAVVP